MTWVVGWCSISGMAAKVTLEELARQLGVQFSGEAGIEIRGVRPFEQARAGDLTLATHRKFLKDLSATGASAVIVETGVESSQKPLLRSDNPKLAFAKALALFERCPFQARGISPLASIGESCRISPEVSIDAFVTVGDGTVIEDQVTLHPGVSVGQGCRIETGSTLHPNVTLYPGVSLGRRVIIHAGSVIGADGFGYVFDGSEQFKIEQTGIVIIHDDVEIGANSCVDRATFGATVLERGVKLDNQVHVAHNCHIGENTVVVGCVGISGSVRIGKNCILAGQAGVIDHINIGDNVTVMVKTAVTKDIPDGMVISGQPGRDHKEELKIQAAVRKLPEMHREWKGLRARLERLEGEVSGQDAMDAKTRNEER